MIIAPDEKYHDYSSDTLEIQCWCGRRIRELPKQDVLDGATFECSGLCKGKFENEGVGGLAGEDLPWARTSFTEEPSQKAPGNLRGSS